MASVLEAQIARQVASAFKGQLLTGTLRRVASSSVDALGDPVAGTATSWSFDGIRDSFNAAYAQAAGIPVTDVKVLIIAGSLDTTPVKGDQVLIRGAWHEVKEILDRDPASATHTLQCAEITDPTG